MRAFVTFVLLSLVICLDVYPVTLCLPVVKC